MALRVLVVHNAYQQRGGEDAVVAAETSMLQARGHEVAHFTRHNDDVHSSTPVRLAARTFWSRGSAREFRSMVNGFRPDVVHAHNTFPLISPAIYWVAARLGVPVIQTLHNFRLLCPQAMFLRQGKVCEDCLGSLPWRGAVHRCYRGSTAQSSVAVGMLSVHRMLGTYQNKVSRYVALNEFCRQKFIQGGLPSERIVVKPNFVEDTPRVSQSREGFLFVGRLTLDKGLDLLLRAATAAPAISVRVAGVGGLADQLADKPNVRALGELRPSEVETEMLRARALVLPSIWYESFPMSLIEAFSCSLPVIASRIGALAEIVEEGVTGLLFNPGDSEDLGRKMQWAQSHPDEMNAMGRRAHALYKAKFTSERNYETLMSIYLSAIAECDASSAVTPLVQ